MTRLISLIRPLITILHPFVVCVHSLCLDICTSFMILRPPRVSRRNIRGFKALGNFCCCGVRVTDLPLKHLICCKIYRVKQAFLSSILFSPLKPHLDSYLHISPFYYFHIFRSILYPINYPLNRHLSGLIVIASFEHPPDDIWDHYGNEPLGLSRLA